MFYYHSRVNLWMVFFYKSIIIIKLIYKIIVKLSQIFFEYLTLTINKLGKGFKLSKLMVE